MNSSQDTQRPFTSSENTKEAPSTLDDLNLTLKELLPNYNFDFEITFISTKNIKTSSGPDTSFLIRVKKSNEIDLTVRRTFFDMSLLYQRLVHLIPDVPKLCNYNYGHAELKFGKKIKSKTFSADLSTKVVQAALESWMRAIVKDPFLASNPYISTFFDPDSTLTLSEIHNTVLKSSQLSKFSHISSHNSWKKRYVALTESHLYYYKENDLHIQPMGVIQLAGSTVWDPFVGAPFHTTPFIVRDWSNRNYTKRIHNIDPSPGNTPYNKNSTPEPRYSYLSSSFIKSYLKVPKTGTFLVKIHQANKLIKVDRKSSDPYVTIHFSSLSPGFFYKTSVVKNSLNPRWTELNEFVFFNIPLDAKTKLICKVWDWNKFNHSVPLGKIEIDVRQLIEHQRPVMQMRRLMAFGTINVPEGRSLEALGNLVVETIFLRELPPSIPTIKWSTGTSKVLFDSNPNPCDFILTTRGPSPIEYRFRTSSPKEKNMWMLAIYYAILFKKKPRMYPQILHSPSEAVLLEPTSLSGSIESQVDED